MPNSPGSRIQIHLAKLGTRHTATLQEAVRVMASRPGYSVTGLVLTNRDGEAIIINAGTSRPIEPHP